jgi:hypothetical protein
MKNKIIVTSVNTDLLDHEDILPKPSSEFIPEWYKNVPVEMKDYKHSFKKLPNLRTVKACPSFTDIFKLGYVFVSPCDIWLKVHENGEPEWRTPHEFFSLDTHPKAQFVDHLPDKNVRYVFKFESPFRVITPKGYSVMQLPMMYHFNPEWYVPYGIIDTDIHHEINQQIFITTDDEVLIKKGTPLNYLIPFKREEYNLDIQHPSKLQKQLAKNHLVQWMRFKNSYVKKRGR